MDSGEKIIRSYGIPLVSGSSTTPPRRSAQGRASFAAFLGGRPLVIPYHSRLRYGSRYWFPVSGLPLFGAFVLPPSPTALPLPPDRPCPDADVVEMTAGLAHDHPLKVLAMKVDCLHHGVRDEEQGDVMLDLCRSPWHQDHLRLCSCSPIMGGCRMRCPVRVVWCSAGWSLRLERYGKTFLFIPEFVAGNVWVFVMVDHEVKLSEVFIWLQRFDEIGSIRSFHG